MRVGKAGFIIDKIQGDLREAVPQNVEFRSKNSDYCSVIFISFGHLLFYHQP